MQSGYSGTPLVKKLGIKERRYAMNGGMWNLAKFLPLSILFGAVLFMCFFLFFGEYEDRFQEAYVPPTRGEKSASFAIMAAFIAFAIGVNFLFAHASSFRARLGRSNDYFSCFRYFSKALNRRSSVRRSSKWFNQ